MSPAPTFPEFHSQICSGLFGIPLGHLTHISDLSGDNGTDSVLWLASPAVAGAKLCRCWHSTQEQEGGGAYLSWLFTWQLAYFLGYFWSLFPWLWAWNSARSSPDPIATFWMCFGLGFPRLIWSLLLFIIHEFFQSLKFLVVPLIFSLFWIHSFNVLRYFFWMFCMGVETYTQFSISIQYLFSLSYRFSDILNISQFNNSVILLIIVLCSGAIEMCGTTVPKH